MAPVATTEDYYVVLEVVQTATVETISKSYKRLALQLHPDRNKQPNATKAFQLLGEAYETLRDETKRRAYDVIYPQIKQSHTASTHQTPPPPRSTSSTADPEDDEAKDNAKLFAIAKSRQERESKWWKSQNDYDCAIFQLTRDIRQLQAALQDLESIRKAEQAEEAAANSWSTWLLSPIYKKPVDTEEEKEHKARERLQRLHSRSFKERSLEKKELELKTQEDLLVEKRKEFELADRRDEQSTVTIENLIRERRERKRRERYQAELQALAKAQREQRKENQRREAEMMKEWQERNERMKEEAAKMRKREAMERAAAERKRQEEVQKCREEKRRVQREQIAKLYGLKEENIYVEDYLDINDCLIRPHLRANPSCTPAASTSNPGNPGVGSCKHSGWWPKLEGRRACGRCYTTYNYLLQCPDCKMEACASCQNAIRPSRRNAKRPAQQQQFRREPSPPPYDYGYYYD